MLEERRRGSSRGRSAPVQSPKPSPGLLHRVGRMIGRLRPIPSGTPWPDRTGGERATAATSSIFHRTHRRLILRRHQGGALEPRPDGHQPPLGLGVICYHYVPTLRRQRAAPRPDRWWSSYAAIRTRKTRPRRAGRQQFGNSHEDGVLTSIFVDIGCTLQP